MSSTKKVAPPETLSPQRNFTLATEDRVRAVAAGPPAFVRRLRAIEDLEEGIVRVLVEQCRKARDAGVAPENLAALAREAAPMRALERLNDLVSRHNRYYSVEANLPMVPRTGELVDRTGDPWRPMVPRSLDELFLRAVARIDAEG